MALDEGRLAALRSTKLSVLVAMITGVPKDKVALPASHPSAVVACVVADRAYVLAESIADLGPALHWFQRQSVGGLTVLADPEVARSLARRAGQLKADIVVLQVEGATASPTSAAPPPLLPKLSDEIWRAAAVMADAGISVLDDHGRLSGEVNGLEIARIEMPTSEEPTADLTLQVGVGEADRQLHDYIHSHADDVANLQRAAAVVREHRRPGAGFHPLTRLARPRWLRSLLMADPSVVGLVELEPQAPLRANPGVFDAEPAAAFSPGDRVTVVCSAGVDPDLIPEAVDYRLRIDPDSRLMLVLPPRDVKLATWGLIELVDNAQISAVEPPW